MLKIVPEVKNLMEWFNRLSLDDKLFLYDTIIRRDEERFKQQMLRNINQTAEKGLREE